MKLTVTRSVIPKEEKVEPVESASGTKVAVPAMGDWSKRHEELPRYRQWQNAMRPEDTGHSDGKVGIPSPTDTVSLFEAQVRDYLNSRLGTTRNRFASEEGTIAAQIAALRPEYDHFNKLLAEKRATTQRPVIIRLAEGTGKLVIVLVTLLSAALMYILWTDKGIQVPVAVAISIFSAVLASLAAYPCGLVFRQSTQQWHKMVAAAVLTVTVCVTLVTAINMRTPSFDSLERGAIGTMIAFAFLIVAACAFLTHDQDQAYADLERKVQKLLPRLSQLEMQRTENKVFHTNVARRHVEIARRMISTYRQANLVNRPKDAPAPAFFSDVPQLPEFADNWLDYLETKQS